MKRVKNRVAGASPKAKNATATSTWGEFGTRSEVYIKVISLIKRHHCVLDKVLDLGLESYRPVTITLKLTWSTAESVLTLKEI